MLDDNLKVLTRRINDLEIELEDKKDKILQLNNENKENVGKLHDLEKNSDRVRE